MEPLILSALVVALAEIDDKTQVAAGAALGIMIADAPAVRLGDAVTRLSPALGRVR